ncbi:Bacteriophage abortive infection AbiH [anaerobic digester metagenome]
MYSTESFAIDLADTLLRIPFYFNQWILTIEINKRTVKNDFLRLINKESDLFLSFNYTKTLEILYGIKNICHIHGVQGKELLFGHGDEYNYYSDEIYGKCPGTEESFQTTHDNLKKDTQAALDSHKDFFEMLKPWVNNIYSYGFSFSKVDEIYIRKICNTLDTKEITWYLNDFDNEITRDDYKDIIVRCGFEGSFNTYSIIK